MGRITKLGNKNKLENIPHMLRLLADRLETGVMPMPETLMCVATYDPESLPDMFYYGKPRGLMDIAALNVVAQALRSRLNEIEWKDESEPNGAA